MIVSKLHYTLHTTHYTAERGGEAINLLEEEHKRWTSALWLEIRLSVADQMTDFLTSGQNFSILGLHLYTNDRQRNKVLTF